MNFSTISKVALKIAFVLLVEEGSKAQSPTTPISTPVDSDSSTSVRIDVPRPSPQGFPSSPVLPAGSDTAGNEYSSKSDNEPPTDTPRRGELVIAPIPFSNEAFSFGLAPVIEYVFHPDQRD